MTWIKDLLSAIPLISKIVDLCEAGYNKYLRWKMNRAKKKINEAETPSDFMEIIESQANALKKSRLAKRK